MPDRLVLPDCHQPVANDAPASSRGIVVPRTGPCPPGAQPPPVLPRQPGQVSSVPSAIEAVTPGIEPAMTAVQAHVGRLRRSGTESSTPVHSVESDRPSGAKPNVPEDVFPGSAPFLMRVTFRVTHIRTMWPWSDRQMPQSGRADAVDRTTRHLWWC